MGIWIRSGTVSVENGSDIVTGELTTFGVNGAPGNPITINGSRWYELLELDATDPNTKLRLSEPWQEPTVVNGTYAIIPFLGDRTPMSVNVLKQFSYISAGQTDVIETVGAPDPTIAATNVTGKLIAFDTTNRAYYYTKDGGWNGPVSLGGADGADAGFKLTFSNLTATNADPGNGKFRLNNATLTAVTQFAMDDTSADLGNPDIAAYVASWVASTSAVKGTIIVRDVAQPSVFATFALNSISDQTGYTQLNVTHIASHGAFSDGHSFSVAFIRNGDKGDTGTAGLNAGFLIVLDRDTTTMVDPTAGKIKFDAANFSATANIAIDDTSADAGNPPIAALVATWARSTNTQKGQIRIAKVGASGNFVTFDVVSVTAKTGWSQVGVASVASGGTLATGDLCSLTFAQAGDAGTNGNNGTSAWTPLFSIVTDGDRRVFQVSDWTGGSGTKPAIGKYLGSTGFVDAIADAVDVRGPDGLRGDPGANFDPDARGTFSERSTYDAQGEGYCFLSIDGDGASVTTAVLYFKNSATSGDWSDPTPFQGPQGDPGTTDYNALSNKPTLGTVAPLDVDTDGTLAANSDGKVASQKAVKTALATKLNSSALDIDGTMAANSATRVPAQSAVVTYVAAKVAALVNSSPAALDTLKELADALGDDPNFAATVNAALAARASGPASAVDGNISVFDGITGKLIKDSGKSILWLRERLSADRTYYVRTDGSNANSGLANTSGGAFLTARYAYDFVCANLDLAGHTVTISIGAGTFTDPISMLQPWSGGGLVVFTGAGATTIISTTSADAFSNTASLPGAVLIQNMTLQTATSGYALVNYGVGTINFKGITFGATSAYQLAAIGAAAIVQAVGNYSITGGAAGHILAATGGNVFVEAVSVTLTGTPAFLQFARALSLGAFIADGITFSGSATGSRYAILLNSIVNTGGGGASYFPGNSAGTTASGGQYA